MISISLLSITFLSYITLSQCSLFGLKRHLEEMTGAGKDEYGCIASAGYSYCTSTGSCLRPFETACNDCDEYGCLIFHGYTWCEATQKCQSLSYSSCPDQWEMSVTGFGDVDDFGCCISCGEIWCDVNNSCINGNLFQCPYICT